MNPKVSVIIAAKDEAQRIGPLVRRLKLWRRHPEVIVVANGCTDDTAVRARRAGARVIQFKRALGPDVGRAIGLSMARGDACIVLDADLNIQPIQLEPFVKAIENGVDIALNRYPLKSNVRFQHPTAIAKHALNLFAMRADLDACSLTTVPHGLSRKAIQRLGATRFCVPPVAHAIALLDDELCVAAVSHIPVGQMNPFRSKKHQQIMRKLIIGDCLEGIKIVHEQRGQRGGFTDLNRRRDLPESVTQAEDWQARSMTTMAVIPAQNERTLSRVIRCVEAAEIGRICVVQNGVKEQPDATTADGRVMVEHYSEAVGHDVGRAIGCKRYVAEKYLFMDADIPIAKRDITVMVDALDDVDIALNNLDEILPKLRQLDPPSIVKRFLNIATDRPELGVASMTAIPHAIHARVIEKIGAESLSVPPLAQVKALLAGCKIDAVRAVDVIGTNAYRPQTHSVSRGRPVMNLIIGDFLEAIAYLQEQVGDRVYFPDNVRARDVAVDFIEQHSPNSHSPDGVRR